MPILDRLMGLETEYALRFQPRADGGDRPSRFRQYRAVVDRVEQQVATARALHVKEGVFSANGGAIWFETAFPASGGGLIEGSTPECRTPRQLVHYQRAQDQLLGTAAQRADLDGRLSLIKNDRDARGNVYGAQENYEALLGGPAALFLWRCGLILLLPLWLLTWLGIGILIIGLLLYCGLAAVGYLLLRRCVQDQKQLAHVLFGFALLDGCDAGSRPQVRWEQLLSVATRIVIFPLASALLALLGLTAFRRIRSQLTPFLISRMVFTGAGFQDEDDRFQLSDKAPAINCVWHLGTFLRDRPIYTMGHFFKALCGDSLPSLRAYSRLFSRRQRLQIGLGDSNMAELAEYLRVGCTALVLDVIESGALTPMPPLRRPVRALHALCRDVSLRQTVTFADGSTRTALEIQHYYLNACRAFLQRQQQQADEVPPEAWEIVRLWSETLTQLQYVQATGEVPEQLVGAVDWVTKQRLLDEAGAGSTWAGARRSTSPTMNCRHAAISSCSAPRAWPR